MTNLGNFFCVICAFAITLQATCAQQNNLKNRHVDACSSSGCFGIKTTQEVEEYLQRQGYALTSFHTCTTQGATDCQYFLMQTADQKYFIKTGEKVDREAANLLFLSRYGLSCIPKVFPGTSEEKAILIEEFLHSFDYGLQTVEALHSGKIELADFLIFQAQALSLLKEFYSIPIAVNEGPSQLFTPRLMQRMKDLIKDQDVLWMPRGAHEAISLRKLLHTPIAYERNAETQDVLSIMDMVEQCHAMIAKLPPIAKRVLHGDFHAPNLLQDTSGALRTIDLSDIMFGEDPTWDLGKWLNHINRLHRVVKTRLHKVEDPSVAFTFSDIISLKDLSTPHPLLKKVNQEAIALFSKIIDAPEDVVAIRTAAAEFIVNVSTLRRHMIRFPSSSKMVLLCIVDSFHALKTQYTLYAQTHPECLY